MFLTHYVIKKKVSISCAIAEWQEKMLSSPLIWPFWDLGGNRGLSLRVMKFLDFPRGGSRAASTSKMEFTKHSILGVTAALDPPLLPDNLRISKCEKSIRGALSTFCM